MQIIGRESRSSSTYVSQNRLQNKVTRDKGHYIMIKGSLQQEDITIINIYAPNRGAPTYVKQILAELKGKIECNAFILGYFNTPLTPKDRSMRQKISKVTEALNNVLE